MGVRQGDKTDDVTLENEGEHHGHQLFSVLCSWSISLSEQPSNSVLVCAVEDIHSLPSYLPYVQLLSSLRRTGSSVLKF